MVNKSQHFVVRESGSDSWGNVFLANDWTLYVDWTREQHDAAMERLGIHHGDVLVSGHIYYWNERLIVSFRTSPGYIRGDLTAEDVPVICREVSEFLEARR